MALKRRGHTLLELVVYCGLVVLAGLVIWALFMVIRRTQTSTTSSYMVGGRSETAIGWLRRDLAHTALPTIQVYDSPPGISMVSAMGDKELKVNAYGVPLWDHHVYYSLVGGPETGNLVRWEKPIAAPDMLPSLAPSSTPPGDARTILPNVLMPGVGIKNSVGELASYTGDAFGGFRVGFVERANGEAGAETVTRTNPALGASANNTRLVEVELKILQRSALGKPDFYTIKFRVFPRY